LSPILLSFKESLHNSNHNALVLTLHYNGLRTHWWYFFAVFFLIHVFNRLKLHFFKRYSLKL
jgi:hypothetical protein